MNLSILYRGTLASCNYGCSYCPFAKRNETRAEHAHDQQALERFVAWVAAQSNHTISVFFTPWGEALIRRRYQQAIATLTHLPNVAKVAIQTNLACRLDWVEQCARERLGLWATYHPTQVTRARFLARCADLDRRSVRFSVGMVGMQAHLPEIAALRRELSSHIYLWVNAYKRVPDYYSADQIAHLTGIDPLFPVNNQRHPSRGHACRSGESVIAVDGAGTLRRCHFVREPLGNIYTEGWEQALQPRPCPNETCGCHIGYVHMPHLGLYEQFGAGVLERVPQRLD
jgi:MoaA/NifB/PqqE/SkfB family radical SAM enzyme